MEALKPFVLPNPDQVVYVYFSFIIKLIYDLIQGSTSIALFEAFWSVYI